MKAIVDLRLQGYQSPGTRPRPHYPQKDQRPFRHFTGTFDLYAGSREEQGGFRPHAPESPHNSSEAKPDQWLPTGHQ
jgi:hypothetical protein